MNTLSKNRKRKITFIIVVVFLTFKSFAQTKNFIDQPFIETEAVIDSLVIPDRIFITIILNESDGKNKKSTEELERSMQKVLESLDIDTEKDLSLLDFNSGFKKYFLKEKKILKTKMYSLIVGNALKAGKVLAALEAEGISNATIEKTEFSQAEELMIVLKSEAVLQAKKNAEHMLAPIDQEVGTAIFISDLNDISNQFQERTQGIQIRAASGIYGNRASEPIMIEFDKIKFSSKVMVRFKIE